MIDKNLFWLHSVFELVEFFLLARCRIWLPEIYGSISSFTELFQVIIIIINVFDFCSKYLLNCKVKLQVLKKQQEYLCLFFNFWILLYALSTDVLNLNIRADFFMWFN